MSEFVERLARGSVYVRDSADEVGGLRSDFIVADHEDEAAFIRSVIVAAIHTALDEAAATVEG